MISSIFCHLLTSSVSNEGESNSNQAALYAYILTNNVSLHFILLLNLLLLFFLTGVGMFPAMIQDWRNSWASGYPLCFDSSFFLFFFFFFFFFSGYFDNTSEKAQRSCLCNWRHAPTETTHYILTLARYLSFFLITPSLMQD